MDDHELAERYYLGLAAAFARGRLGGGEELTDAQALLEGRRAGLRLHRFKRSAELPRVRRVLGILRGFAPGRLVDVGSGRGVFLWPLLDSFPDLAVIAVETDERHAADIQALRDGGLHRLSSLRADAEALNLADHSVDGVTVLEVLEHVQRPARLAAEALRVARRFAIVSVPSHQDDNPGHLRLFTRESLTALLEGAGARRVQVEYVLNHMIAVAHV